MKKNNLFYSFAAIVNVIFPILTTPFVAKSVGINGFYDVSMAALVSYIVGTISDSGFSFSGAALFAKFNSNQSKINKIISAIKFWQIKIYFISALFCILLFRLYLNVGYAFIFIGLIGALFSFFVPPWQFFVKGRGQDYLSAVLFGRIISIVSLIICEIYLDSTIAIAFCWIVLPGVPLFLFADIKIINVSKIYKKYAFLLIKENSPARFLMMVYGVIPSMLLGNMYDKNIAGAYMFLDRIRVVGQSLICSQFPLIAKLRLRNIFYADIFLLCCSVGYFVAYYFVIKISGNNLIDFRQAGAAFNIWYMFPSIGVVVVLSNYLINVIFKIKKINNAAVVVALSGVFASIVFLSCIFFNLEIFWFAANVFLVEFVVLMAAVFFLRK